LIKIYAVIFIRIWHDKAINFPELAQKFDRFRTATRNQATVKNFRESWANSQAKKVIAGSLLTQKPIAKVYWRALQESTAMFSTIEHLKVQSWG
jgi:hypothetical protein